MSVTWAGQNTAVNLATTSSVGTGATGTPVGPAGGDLQGSYPNPTVHRIHGVDIQGTAPADLDMWQYHAANNRWRHRTWSQTMTDNGVTAAGLAILDDADAAAQRTTLGLGTTDSPKFAEISFTNDESIRNTVNGRVDIMPAPLSSTAFGLYIDTTTYTFGVGIGIIQSNTGTLNPSSRALRFECATLMGNGVDFGVGSNLWYTISAQGTSQQVMTIGVLTGDQNAGSSGALAIVQNNQRGLANRIPTTDHADPTLYLYGRGSTNAAHYMRLNHDTTNGTIETGAGVLTLVGASGVRMNGGFGFGTAPTAVQTGYTTFTNLTTDRTCDADATTVAELADILGTLIVDLKAKGIIA